MEPEQARREYEMLLSEEKRVTGLLREAEREYALALGESIGVKLGSVVTTTQIGFAGRAMASGSRCAILPISAWYIRAASIKA